MSTLSSSSTDAEVRAAYDDNASYVEDDSATKAAAFVTAVRILLRRLPKRTSKGGREGSEIELEPKILREELVAAQEWLSAHGQSLSSGAVRFADLRDFRT